MRELEQLDEESLARLTPLWREALRALGGEATEGRDGFVRREDGSIRLDNELLLSILTQGRPRSLVRQARLQWRIEKYLASSPVPSSSETAEAMRVRSLVLGLCQQAILMRLPAHSEADLARWLARVERAPRAARASLKQVLGLQKLRDALSGTRKGLFAEPREAGEAPPTGCPPGGETNTRRWQGLPVCWGSVEGPFWIVPDKPGATPPEGADIFVFRRAHPDAVTWYERARAVVFAQGGVLSHACSVAREMGLPCLTGVGACCLAELRKASPEARLRITVSEKSSELELLTPGETVPAKA
jgi:phosphohistidine swiveling domain-containing protein